MHRDPTTNKVSADSKKGMITFSRNTAESDVLKSEYFVLKWLEKDSKAVEESYILFPHAYEIKSVHSGGKGGGIYCLYKRTPATVETNAQADKPTPASPMFIFWLQESPESFDEKLQTMNNYLRTSEQCRDGISASDAEALHELFQQSHRASTLSQRHQPNFPSLKEILQDPNTLDDMCANAEFYCRAIEHTLPTELRRDLNDSGLTNDDFSAIFRSYVQNKEVREGADILQQCIDSGWNPAYVAREMCGIETSKQSESPCGTRQAVEWFLEDPSTESLLKLFVAAEAERAAEHEGDPESSSS